MTQSEDPRGLGRREFLQLLGAAGIVTALPSAATALQASATPPVPAPTTPPAATPATPPASDAPSAEAVAFAAILRQRYPERLSDEQWKSVTGDLDGRLASGKRLRATKLANGDEPDATFRA